MSWSESAVPQGSNVMIVPFPTRDLSDEDCMVFSDWAQENGCFLTGSREYGGESAESDWDIACLEDTGFCCAVMSHFDWESPASSGNYSTARCGKLNFVPLSKDDFAAWQFATRQLSDGQIQWRDKAHRVETFKEMLCIFKS